MLARVVLQESPWKSKINQSYFPTVFFSVLAFSLCLLPCRSFWYSHISCPPPHCIYYSLWWFLLFSRQDGHSLPQSVIKGISNCTKCYLLELGFIYIYLAIICTFFCSFVAFAMFCSLYFKLEDRFHRSHRILHCVSHGASIKHKFNEYESSVHSLERTLKHR